MNGGKNRILFWNIFGGNINLYVFSSQIFLGYKN